MIPKEIFLWWTKDGKSGDISPGPALPNNEKLKSAIKFQKYFLGISESGKLYQWSEELINAGGGIEKDAIMVVIKQVGNKTNWQSIISGSYRGAGYVCIVNSDGEAFAFGDNTDGILATSKPEKFIADPQKVDTNVRFAKIISSNDGAFFGIRRDGDLYTHGAIIILSGMIIIRELLEWA